MKANLLGLTVLTILASIVLCERLCTLFIDAQPDCCQHFELTNAFTKNMNKLFMTVMRLFQTVVMCMWLEGFKLKLNLN